MEDKSVFVKHVGGAELFSDGTLICWGFECICKYDGNCEVCPTSIGYWESCKSNNKEE